NRLDFDRLWWGRRLGSRQRWRRNRWERFDSENRRWRFDPRRRRFGLAGVSRERRRCQPHALDRRRDGFRRGPPEEHEAGPRRRARGGRRQLDQVDPRRADRDVEHGTDELRRRVDEAAPRFDHWQPKYRRERTYSCGVPRRRLRDVRRRAVVIQMRSLWYTESLPS